MILSHASVQNLVSENQAIRRALKKTSHSLKITRGHRVLVCEVNRAVMRSAADTSRL